MRPIHPDPLPPPSTSVSPPAAVAPQARGRATARPRPKPVPVGNIRMIVLDIDGTLLRADKRLSPRTIEAIHAARARGVRVVLASARPPRLTRGLFTSLDLDTLQVNYNGALIFDQPANRQVLHQPLDGPLARRIIKAARKVVPELVVSVEILDKWYTDHVDETLPTETSVAFTPDFIGPVEAFTQVPVTKLMLLAVPERLEPVIELVARKFRKHVVGMRSDPHLLQVVHPQVDKGIAAAHVAREYGIDAEQVMAIGDAGNDVGLLRWAGLGVAVENAWPVAREAANVIVPSNNDDGVAFAIQRYVLSR